MIYEKLPDTVEAVQYTIVDDRRFFSAEPTWLLALLYPTMGCNPQSALFEYTGRLHYHDKSGDSGTLNPGNWLVKDEKGTIAIYDDETFIRKFKKVS
jgi:hypothetical protein